MKEVIGKFVMESQEISANNKKEGKEFNIFNELTINTKEVKHSLMIKSLITPNGNHGMGTIFYDLFIEQLNFRSDYEWLKDYNNIKVYDEYFIGNKNEEASNEELKESYWGRIDLLIENKKAKKAIVIENKIYANDQPIQLIRYNNYAKDTYGKDNYTLVYLTLDGKKPSCQSYLGNEDCLINDNKYQIDLNTIKLVSYSDHILNWLTSCSVVPEINNPVKNIIEQYICNIKELTYKMESINKDLLIGKYKELLKVITVRDIIEVRDEIRKRFFIELNNKLNQLDLVDKTQYVHSINEDVDNINNVLNSNGHVKNFGIKVKLKNGGEFNIEVQNYGDLIYGFFNNNEVEDDDYKQLEKVDGWLRKIYKINKEQTYSFYDDRLNYYLLENIDCKIENKYCIIDDLIVNIKTDLNL